MWSSILPRITSSIAAVNTLTSDEIQNLAGKGCIILNSFRDKSSEVARALHQELHSLSSSTQKLCRDEGLRFANAGESLWNSTEGLFQHAMEHYPSEKVTEFKENLRHIFHAAFEELKVQFPPPEEAPGHENRTIMISAMLDRTEEGFIQFPIKHGVSEEPLKCHFSSLKFHVQHVLVIIGTLPIFYGPIDYLT
ncbi:hypothetical protein AZE42_10139 [Rhizopogon vesiculosus]|uniref:Uncharacterized protein n=1 Tax=Rhizopogon vesiculosus TaxID=180088 RepID=A0A1J8PSZ1_9AGAM|nr:hypothetical protein AZE42_10139 [Rhizopogon vesiculosus]